MDENTTMTEQATETTATQPVNTPAAAAEQQQTVDVSAITQAASQKATEAAEKKMEAVFKSMLQQNGLDTETINKMTAEWKSQQQTPEQILEERNKKIEDLQKELEQRDKASAIKAAKDDIAQTLRGENLNPDAINLILAFFPEDKAVVKDGSVTNKDEIVEIIRKSSPGLFGKEETRSADVATPPANNNTDKDPFLEGFEDK